MSHRDIKEVGYVATIFYLRAMGNCITILHLFYFSLLF